MSSIYVDETTGSDETGKGTAESPYHTLAFALFTHVDASLLSRKDASAQYEEPTQSALKKAKKGAEGLEKKKKKAEELAERDAQQSAQERERKEKLIEESKKIVLVNDESLPKATKVRYEFLLLAVCGTDGCICPCTGKVVEPCRASIATCESIRLGASSTRSERYHVPRAQRWHWLPPMYPHG